LHRFATIASLSHIIEDGGGITGNQRRDGRGGEPNALVAAIGIVLLLTSPSLARSRYVWICRGQTARDDRRYGQASVLEDAARTRKPRRLPDCRYCRQSGKHTHAQRPQIVEANLVVAGLDELPHALARLSVT